MRGTLILLTKNFPFDTLTTPAESYLQHEVPLLAREYRRIVVVATEACRNATVREDLPDNVLAVSAGLRQTNFRRLYYGFTGAFNRGEWRRRYSSLAELEGKVTFKGRLFERYFFGKAKTKYLRIAESLLPYMGSDSDIYSFWLFDTALVAVWLSQERSARRVFARAHRYDLYEAENRLRWLPARQFFREHLDVIFACSENGRAHLASSTDIGQDNVRLGYLGTKPIECGPIGQASSEFQLVSCSRLSRVKRVPIIMDAMRELDLLGRAVCWTHFGGGNGLDELAESARSLRNIRVILRGPTTNSEVIANYETVHFDLFLNVSESEGLPISIMEACGAGIPVMATDVGGTGELVRAGLTGVLIDADVDGPALCKQIEKFMDMGEEERVALRQGARNMWEEQFQLSMNVSKALQELDAVERLGEE